MFTDIIRFTTMIDASVSPELRLDPIKDHMRAVKASGEVSGSRKDTHQLTVSFAFPDIDVLLAPRDHDFSSARSIGGYGLSDIPRLSRRAVRTARINFCVERERAREEQFETLRNVPPQAYCASWVDQLFAAER
ncbi:MAG: hypothetical protein AB7F78_09155 [Hyphomicrobiaceae bacterium]